MSTSTKPSLAQHIQVDTSPARIARLWDAVSVRLSVQPGRSRGLAFRAGLGVMLATVAGIALFFYLEQGRPGAPWQRAALETAGDTLVVDLDDGSRLELGARSRVEMVETSATAVSVRLNHGRVECDLKPRKGRRFAVLAAGVEVRVTGTRFSVELSPDKRRVEVAVSRGSVEVTSPHGLDQTRKLTAGERLSIDLAAKTAVQAPSAAPEPPAASASALEPEVANPPAERPSAAREVRPQVTLETANARELLDLGNAARRAGDVAGAGRAYELMLSKYGSDPRAGLAAFELGRLRMGPLRDLGGAVHAFQRAIALAPASGFREDAMARLVEAYAALGRTAECRSARDAYLKSYPQGVHAGAVTEKFCPR
ncbi:MAG TPA: FecR domain-containing protein [Polyangiaceae bacterium]